MKEAVLKKEEVPKKVTEPEKKKRKGRGATYMPTVIRKKIRGSRSTVAVNRRGQLVGPIAVELQSYVGVLARQSVPITITTWHKVPNELKNKIWEQILAFFYVDRRAKKRVLSSAAAKWKQFKSRLSTRHIIPFKNNLEMLRKPPSVYNFITQKEWEGFVALRLSAKYLKMRENATAWIRSKKYNHHLSRRGYANKELDIQAESGITDEIERHEMWKIAHTKKKWGDEITKKRKEGAVTFSEAEDVLTAAIGPEHPGHVRARGFGTNPSSREEDPLMFAQQIAAMQEEIRGLKSSQNYNGIDGTPKMNNSFSAQNYRKEDTPKCSASMCPGLSNRCNKRFKTEVPF
ncbi:hypothetical protein UlMin_007084 [Ulmus minor]